MAKKYVLEEKTYVFYESVLFQSQNRAKLTLSHPPHFRYVSFVYSLDFLQQQQKVSADQALAMGVICNTVNLVLWPLSGMLVDKYGVGLVFLIGEVCGLSVLVLCCEQNV